MVFLRKKIRFEDVKDFKIERKVFDERTLYTIYKLMTKGFIKSVESAVKEGKESLVLSAKGKNNNWLALKIYRTKYCDFKSMWKYLVGDPRFSGIKKSRRAVIFNWCKREFKNLKIAFKAKVSVPRPITFKENVLVIDFIGKNGKLAPRLINVKLKPRGASKIYAFILGQIKKLVKAGLVHSDLSAYNILIWDKPYLIDFSQAVPLKHQLAKQFLERDIKNINSYFKKVGVKVKDPKDQVKKLIGG